MRDLDLFRMALGVFAPWFVEDSDFDAKEKRLDIHIDFHKGGHSPVRNAAKAAASRTIQRS